jgi:steroid delta-isomerase-like uncharacterized protein
MADQPLVDAAKASVIAYNDKDWDAVRRTVTPDFDYDEVSTGRNIKGIDDVLTAWKGWATAIPDSRATIDRAHVSGNTVVLEMTWRGKQTGALTTPAGEIPASGKPIEIRACQVVEVENGKTRSVRHYFDMATLLRQIGADAVRA